MERAVWAAGAWELADAVRAGELKAVEVLDTLLERIGRFDGRINSFVMVDPDGAREQAERVDRAVLAGEDPGPLAGVAVGVKDLQDVAGLPTGRGSLLFRDAIAPADSTFVARLRRAGAVILGKTTTPEEGSLNYTDSPATGTTRNPWNTDRTPGGSSGGSAAAVASGLVPLATGSDGGGSIRIPAAFSGLPGLKTTFGLIARGPRRIGSANMSSLGPVARTVRDIARTLDLAAGPDPMDPFSLPAPGVRFEASLEVPLDGLRAAWSPTLGFGVCEPEVAEVARAAAARLFEAAGIVEVDRPVDLPDPGASWAAAAAVDIYCELEEFWPARGSEMTPVVAVALQLAESLTAGQHAEGIRVRQELVRRVCAAFEEVDLIVTPSTPTVAFAAAGPLPHEVAGHPLGNPLHAICFSYPFNLTGHPAMTVPAGLDTGGMPVGLQIVGRRFAEATLLSAARVMERVSPWPALAPGYE